MTYSLESAFVRAYAAGAVAVQAVLDVTRKLNEITRPPRRSGGFDEDAAAAYLDEVGVTLSDKYRPAYEAAKARKARERGAEQLAEREAEEECSEPRILDNFIPGPIVDERYCGSLQPAGTMSYRCTKRLGHDGAHGYNGVVWEADEPPPLNNPSTLDDILAQLCQLTYFVEDMRNHLASGDQSERADTQDAQMWRAFVNPDAPVASTAGPSGEAVSAQPPVAPASPRSDFAKGVEAAANIVAEEAQRIWREVLGAPDARPLLDGMSVAFGLDRLTQELRDHANEYSK